MIKYVKCRDLLKEIEHTLAYFMYVSMYICIYICI